MNRRTPKLPFDRESLAESVVIQSFGDTNRSDQAELIMEELGMDQERLLQIWKAVWNQKDPLG